MVPKRTRPSHECGVVLSGPNRMKPPYQRGMGLGGTRAKEAHMPLRQGL